MTIRCRFRYASPPPGFHGDILAVPVLHQVQDGVYLVHRHHGVAFDLLHIRAQIALGELQVAFARLPCLKRQQSYERHEKQHDSSNEYLFPEFKDADILQKHIIRALPASCSDGFVLHVRLPSAPGTWSEFGILDHRE
ncbi:hypothetical protein [Nitratidesulfovibrio sp. 1201_IL3209]|uniref:hypothetical protein n=1 Tax=Nitratidesulfovibrio sp. 1201_IL3209 TaxID=3084053 RepID=UPI002FD9953B